jgi:chromosome partitioning protein
MRVLSLFNWKGGVGKTTIATNLAQLLSILGNKVLVIDNDQQFNLSLSLGIQVADCKVTLSDVMGASPTKFEKMVGLSIYDTMLPGLDCIPGDPRLGDTRTRNMFFRDLLQTKIVAEQKYGIVIIDNPPYTADRVKSALVASNLFLVPVVADLYAITGLVGLFENLTKQFAVDPQKIKILLNMFHGTRSAYNRVLRDLQENYPDNLLKTIVPDDYAFRRILLELDLEKSVYERKTVFFSDTRAKATLVMQRLACELFGFNEEEMLEVVKEETREYRASAIRERMKRLYEHRNKNVTFKTNAEEVDYA